MSSTPELPADFGVFLTPPLPIHANLFDQDEINEFRRKLLALNKLCANKRSKNPEIQPFVAQVVHFYRSMIGSAHWVYRKNTRERYFASLRMIGCTENIVVRYIINEEDLGTLVMKAKPVAHQ